LSNRKIKIVLSASIVFIVTTKEWKYYFKVLEKLETFQGYISNSIPT